MVCPPLDKMNTWFIHRGFFGDHLFVDASDDNNVVVLIHITPESADTPEAEITY